MEKSMGAVRKIIQCLLLVASMTCYPGYLSAQNISNVTSVVSGKEIMVTYDIINAAKGQTFDVSLWYSIDGNAYRQCNSIRCSDGNCKGITAGTGKSIVWTVLDDLSSLKCASLVFEVRALLHEPAPVVVANSSGKDYTETVNGVKIEMVYIKGGTFMMGSPASEANRGSDENQHSVTLSGFYMGKYEVTQAQWQAVMGSNPSSFSGCANCPVEQVSWDDAQKFIQKLNDLTGKKYALPTEAQWEYACRSGSTTPFNTGNCLSTDQVNYYGGFPYGSCSTGKYLRKTSPIGSYAPNAWELFDMHGNVVEWCSDWYDGSYPTGQQTDPAGPSSGSYRVFRGGHWQSSAQDCRSAYRGSTFQSIRSNTLGFRLVCLP